MPVFLTQDKVLKGMPAGGIGAGKLEVLPNGCFDAFTFMNNWSDPWVGSGNVAGLLGYHLAVRTPQGSLLLQTAPLLNLPRVKNIRYESSFPKTTLVYGTEKLGLGMSLEYFSPWVPADVKNSSLPAVFFKLRVKNTLPRPQKVSLMFIGRNPVGVWCVGRRNRVVQDPATMSLEFFNEDKAPLDDRRGCLRFTFEKKGWDLSFSEAWNAVGQNFSFTEENIKLPVWESFSKAGHLPNARASETATGENRELCGAVAAERVIGARSQTELLFSASWFFPHHAPGHRYRKIFKSVAQVSSYARAHRQRLEIKTARLHKLVSALPFPEWFNDALLTNLSPFFASSWHTENGRFAFYEAPLACPLMGTLDVGFYGSIPLSYFFPELEYSQILQFALAQRPDGYIPHDLGKNRLDLPSDGTTFYFWKDLNPKFVLMAMRDYHWSGRRDWLARLYPPMKKAMEWTSRADRNGDGLPDHEGADQTFDLWNFRGANAYTAGLYIAALLAARRAAEIFRDVKFATTCDERYRKARNSFESRLWNGRFFGETCTVSQLNGQWYASLLGLGEVADATKIRTALGSILKLNGQNSPFGFVNSVHPDGRRDLSNNHSQNTWIGMNWALVSLGLLNNLPLKELLKAARPMWDNVLRQKSPWDQPDMIDAKTGKFMFGDFYYRNIAIWSIPLAHAMKNKKTASLLSQIRSLGKRA